MPTDYEILKEMLTRNDLANSDLIAPNDSTRTHIDVKRVTIDGFYFDENGRLKSIGVQDPWDD